MSGKAASSNYYRQSWLFSKFQKFKKIQLNQTIICRLRKVKRSWNALACENIRFSTLFVAGDVSRGGTKRPQRRRGGRDGCFRRLEMLCPYKIFTEISARFLNLSGQNPAEISRNLGGQNTAEISKSRRPKSCRESHAENILQGRYCFGHPNKMFRFPLPSLSWRWVGR